MYGELIKTIGIDEIKFLLVSQYPYTEKMCLAIIRTFIQDKHIFLVKKVAYTKMYSSGQSIFKVHTFSVGL